MATTDPFARRTLTPQLLATWGAELLASLPGALSVYGPTSSLGARTREKAMVAAAEVDGARYCVWVHGEWRDFLGEGALPGAEAAVVTYAEQCAEAGRPLPLDSLENALPPRAIKELRATVARIELEAMVGNTVDALLARFTKRRPFDPVGLAREAAVLAASAPIVVPMAALAGAMRVANALAPTPPDVDVVVEEGVTPNLLVAMLQQTLPAYLSSTPTRLALAALPVPMSVAVQSGPMAATVTVGGGQVSVRDGIHDALLVVEGEPAQLLEIAAGQVVQNVTKLRVRPA